MIQTQFTQTERIREALRNSGPNGMTKRDIAVKARLSIKDLGPLLHNLLLAKEITKRTENFAVYFQIAASSEPT